MKRLLLGLCFLSLSLVNGWAAVNIQDFVNDTIEMRPAPINDEGPGGGEGGGTTPPDKPKPKPKPNGNGTPQK